MAVNLSPVGGVAAQFFTNTGAVLTGGKLYTYAAGTTTPQAAYTSSNGATPWTNPIVLDAAGRVSGSGEIWLTDGINYKFVLKDSNDVLIATYDNISGINSNSISFTNQQQIVTATAGQTVFNLSISYQPGTNSLSVFVDGVNQYGPGATYAYTETDSDTVTFVSGLHVGAQVKFTTTQQQGAGAVDSSQVTYDPPFTGSVATNVEAKLAQSVSVLDFGASPSASAAVNDTAFAAALAASGSVYVPPGTYNISATITLNEKTLWGNNRVTTILKPSAAVTTCINLNNNGTLSGITLDGTNTTNATGIIVGSVFSNVAVARDVIVTKFLGATAYGILCFWIVQSEFNNVRSDTNNKGLYITNPGGAGSFPTFMVFDNCQFVKSTLHGAYIINGYGITFNNCDFEYNTNEGVYIPANGVVDRVNFNNCWFERNFDASATDYQARFDGSAGGAVLQFVNVNSCFFYNGTAKAAIFIKSQDTTFQSNKIPPVAGTVLFNANSFGYIVAQDTTYIVDSTGFMEIYAPYKESTFTPTIIGTTTAGVGTYTTQVGQYTKIGNTVFVTIDLAWTNHTGTGSIRIAGLPFASRANGGNPAAAITSDNLALTAGNYLTAYVINGLAQIYPIQGPTGGGVEITVPIDTAASIQVSATYRI